MIGNSTLPNVRGLVAAFVNENKLDGSTPPILVNAVRHPSGAFQFQFSLGEDCPYGVQASTDLKNWVQLSKGEHSAGKMDYVDSDAPKFSHRFYRIVSDFTPSKNI